MTLPALINTVIEHLDGAGVPYMVTGSVASSYHGEPRATRDLDVVIDPDGASLASLVGRLGGAGLYVDREAALVALATRGQFNAIDRSSGWKVDFVIRRDRPFSREEFGRRLPAELLGTPAWIVTPEDAILVKLEWALASGSDRQLTDASALLRIGRDTLDFGYLDRWADELGLREAWSRLRDEA